MIKEETWIAGSSAQVQSLDLSDLSDLDPGTYFWRVSTLDASRTAFEKSWTTVTTNPSDKEPRQRTARPSFNVPLLCTPLVCLETAKPLPVLSF